MNELYKILYSVTFLFSFEWSRVCRVPVYELHFPTQIFNIRARFPNEYFIFYSGFILANVVILNSNANCKILW